MSEIKGYAILTSLSHCIIGMDRDLDPELYNQICKRIMDAPYLAIMDIGINNSGLLLIEPKGACIVDCQDMKDIRAWFQCDELGDILLPPGLSETQQLVEFSIRHDRPGGYNPIIRSLVIAASLQSGKFNDKFLFQTPTEG